MPKGRRECDKLVYMPPKKLSAQEIKAVAEAAITAQQVLTDARAAHEADPEDTDLTAALEEAERNATAATAAADALSQDTTPAPDKNKKVEKLQRRRRIIERQLDELGVDEDEEEEDDEEDLDKPVTRRDLQRIETQKAAQTAMQMTEQITDADRKAAVVAALKRLVPSGDPQKDFGDAVAIASRERNDAVLVELGRKIAPVRHASGAGAPAKAPETEFVPTAQEAAFMRPPFNLTKAGILDARAAAAKVDPQTQ